MKATDRALASVLTVDLASAAMCGDLVEVGTRNVHTAHDQVRADLALVPARLARSETTRVPKIQMTIL